MFSPASTSSVAVRVAVDVLLLSSPVHDNQVSDHPACAVSVTVLDPSWDAGTVNVVVLGGAPPASSSSENGPNDPVYAKSCVSSGIASLTIVIVASFVFTNVHVMFSPASTSSVAVRVAVDVLLLSSPVHDNPVSDHPACAVSVTVLDPRSAAGTVNVVELGSVALASSSSENGPNDPVYAKSCASSGTASLTIVTVASFVFTNVHVMFSPASTSSVAARVAVDVLLLSSPVHDNPVSDHPACALSVTVLDPRSAAGTVNVVVLGSAPPASSSSENGPNDPEYAKSCASFGIASLTIVTFASFVLVYVQSSTSPALSMANVTVPFSTLVVGATPWLALQSMFVRLHPSGTTSSSTV